MAKAQVKQPAKPPVKKPAATPKTKAGIPNMRNAINARKKLLDSL